MPLVLLATTELLLCPFATHLVSNFSYLFEIINPYFVKSNNITMLEYCFWLNFEQISSSCLGLYSYTLIICLSMQYPLQKYFVLAKFASNEIELYSDIAVALVILKIPYLPPFSNIYLIFCLLQSQAGQSLQFSFST